MKNCYIIILLIVLGVCNQISGQTTKILDSSVNWSKGTLRVFLTDSLITSVSIQIGTEFLTNNVFNETSLTPGTDFPLSNTLVIPLTGVTQGVYYVDVKVNTNSNGIQEMEFQTSN